MAPCSLHALSTLLLLTLLSGHQVWGLACVDDAGCSHNGRCDSGTCRCHTPWSGSSCSKLRLGVVDKDVFGYREGFPMTTSWGGSVQWDEESNQYLMLVSEYVEQCSTWGYNSAVVVAASNSAEGPYTKLYRLTGVMTHEAMWARGPDGEWVVYFTGRIVSGTSLPPGSDDGTATMSSDTGATWQASEVCTRDAGDDSACTCPDGDNHDKGSNDPTWMIHTSTPLVRSSWSAPVKVMDPGPDGWTDLTHGSDPQDSIDANFNGVIRDDGSFVGLWRTWECADDLVGELRTRYGSLDGCTSVPHAVTATNWEDEETYSTYSPQAKKDLTWLFADEYGADDQFALGIEDPMVYVDSRSPGVFHAIFHTMFTPKDNVAHAYSEDGENWIWTGDALEYNGDQPEVEFSDGTVQGLDCERPQLIVEDGVPTHLIIGGIPRGLGTEASPAIADVNEHCDQKDWPCGATMVIPLVAGDESSSASMKSTLPVTFAAAVAAVLLRLHPL